MYKRLNILVLFFCLSAFVFGNDINTDNAGTMPANASPVFQEFLQSFSKANLPEKIEVLRKVSAGGNAADVLGKINDYALQFAHYNCGIYGNDSDFIQLISIAANGVSHAGYSESVDILWDIFLIYPDSILGDEIIISLGNLGQGNEKIIMNINNFVLEQSSLYRSGGAVNYQVLSACIAAILELKDSSSYPALFSVLHVGFPEVIAFEASGALDLIPGDYAQFLYNVIEKNPPDEKLTAFKAGISSARLSVPERGRLAELALEQSLARETSLQNAPNSGDNADLSAMRYVAVLTLTPLRWMRASNLAVRHYYRVQSEYQLGTASKEQFLEAIACLGAVGNSNASLALALQLGLINARTEKTGFFDTAITLATIQSLGLIGDKAVFDHLYQVRFLTYPENILAAAREAIDRLKW